MGEQPGQGYQPSEMTDTEVPAMYARRLSHPERRRTGLFLESYLPSWRREAEAIVSSSPGLRAAATLLDKDAIEGLTVKQKAALFFNYLMVETQARIEGLDNADQVSITSLQHDVILQRKANRFSRMVALQQIVNAVVLPNRQAKTKYPLVREFTSWVYDQLSLAHVTDDKRRLFAKDIVNSIPDAFLSEYERNNGMLPEVQKYLLNKVNGAVGVLRSWDVVDYTFRQKGQRQRMGKLLSRAILGHTQASTTREERSDWREIKTKYNSQGEIIGDLRRRIAGRGYTLTRKERQKFYADIRSAVATNPAPEGGWNTKAGRVRLRELTGATMADGSFGNLLRRNAAHLGL